MKKSTPYVRPFGRPLRRPLWQRVAGWLATVALVTALVLLLAVGLVEWAVGCGESYVDANGVRHINDCVFIPQRKEQQ